MYSKDSPIVVVGAGVFGLSNALHLAQSGYTNVTVFDRLDFNANHYTLLEGADTASADVNKIFRAQYAGKMHYQKLAFQAFDIWQKWDRELPLAPAAERSKYTGDKILDLCSMLRLDDRVSEEETSNRESFAKEGIASLRYDLDSEADLTRAYAAGLSHKIGFVDDLKNRGLKNVHGALDTTSGVLYASRGCQYAKYQCELLGVKFILGGDKGTFDHYLTDANDKTAICGIATKDGKQHFAQLVVVSCGPWTTRLVPELDGINEATGGNVVVFKIPEHRKDLYEKYRSRNFPIVGWKTGHSREKDFMGGMFMFPVMEPEGYMKMIVRQTKYTNPIKLENGRVVSVPWTSNSDPPADRLTDHIVKQLRSWLQVFFPDLVEAGIKLEPKVLWYTDTINNDYIYDFVPGKKNLFVACGGSGHAFKMLPVLGQFLVDKMEGRENFYTNLFKWRFDKDFKNDVNGLREGLDGNRVYSKQKLAKDDQFWMDAKTKENSRL